MMLELADSADFEQASALFGLAPILLRKAVSAPVWLMLKARKSSLAMGLLPVIPAPALRLAAKKGLLPLLVPMDKLEGTFGSILDGLKKPADRPLVYLEFGVNQGSSMVCMSRASATRPVAAGIRLVGFDSFEGLPPETDTEGDQGGDAWHKGDFASPLAFTRAYLKTHGVEDGSVELVKGWFKDTLNAETVSRLNLRHADVIMIDCDIYTATVEALAFCEPLIADRVVMVFDDWGDATTPDDVGEEKAFNEFLETHPEFVAKARDDLKYQRYAKVFELVRNT